MMMISLPFDSSSQTWLHAAARAADWLDAHLDNASRLPPPLHDLGSYYKWPLFLHALGRFARARSVFETAVEHFMTLEGDFRTGTAKSSEPLYGLIADSYTNTWLIAAARIFDRPDVGRPALGCLRRRQVRATGGFLTGRPGEHPDQRQDIVTIAGCGNAFLAWEELEEALAAGDCLLRVLDAQEPVGQELYFYIDGAGHLLRSLELPARLAVLRLYEPGQAYVYLGMAAVYLARLALVAGESRFLNGARRYFAINQACGPAVYGGIGCCKTGWAAAVLCRLTGETLYRQSVQQAAAAILAAQRPEGDWDYGGSAVLNCDVTGELGYHLTQYCLELSSGPP